MIRRFTTIENSPAPIGPYSSAVEWNGLVFLSGIIPLSIQDGQHVVEGNFEQQTKTVLKNLDTVLSGLGLERQNVLKVTAYVTDLSNFAVFNDIYGQFFENHLPARTTVQVSALPRGALVELDCICCRPGKIVKSIRS